MDYSMLREIRCSSGSIHLSGPSEQLLGTHWLLIVSSYCVLFYLLKALIVLMVLFSFTHFISPPTVPLYFDFNLSLVTDGTRCSNQSVTIPQL